MGALTRACVFLLCSQSWARALLWVTQGLCCTLARTHTREWNRFLCQVASLSIAFPIKEKNPKCEILVGLKVLLHEEKKFTKSIVFHLFSHFLMNKYYPLKTFKKVLRYTVLYSHFLY